MTSKSNRNERNFNLSDIRSNYVCQGIIFLLCYLDCPQFLFSQPGFAQTVTPNLNQIPSVITPNPATPLPQKPRQPLPPPEQLLNLPAKPLEIPTGANQSGTVIVQKFTILGSTVFSEAELNAATNQFTKRPITFAELLQARTAITNLYITNGYITSGAYLPPQNLQSGTVTIQVVEGSISEIKVIGMERLDPNYVRSRLNIASGAPLHRDRLINALQILQLNPLMANISAELSVGDRPGQNILEVKVKEANSLNLQLSLDNNRAPSSGSLRRRIQLNQGNLSGIGDSLSLGYSNTDGSNVYDASYTIPINPYNGTLGLSFSNSNSNIIENPFNILDIYANSTTYDLTFRQPLVQTPQQEFAVGITGSYRENLSSLLKIPFPLSTGADNNGVTKVSLVSLFQDYTQRSNDAVLAFRNQLNIGLGGVWGATINSSFPDGRFVSVRSQAQYVKLLAPNTLVLFRSDLQLSDRPLVPQQKIGFGGQDTLRGYRQDLLLGDNGAALSVEIRIPILKSPESEGILHLTPFVDAAMVWQNSSAEANLSPNLLIGTGLGLRWQMGNRLTATLNYGIPLTNVASTRKTWQENGIYFSLSYNF
jgi:hemolysin activation/secretion protein